jgi:hypothetical protein
MKKVFSVISPFRLNEKFFLNGLILNKNNFNIIHKLLQLVFGREYLLYAVFRKEVYD